LSEKYQFPFNTVGSSKGVQVQDTKKVAGKKAANK
jgi:hypothetical protein